MRKTQTTEHKILLASKMRDLLIIIEATLRVLSVEDDIPEAIVQTIERAISDVLDELLNP